MLCPEEEDNGTQGITAWVDKQVATAPTPKPSTVTKLANILYE